MEAYMALSECYGMLKPEDKGNLFLQAVVKSHTCVEPTSTQLYTLKPFQPRKRSGRS